MSEKYDIIIEEIKALREENRVTKRELSEVKKRLVRSEDDVKSLTERLNDLDQYGRRVNLEIQGVPVRGEKLEDEKTEDVVRDLAGEINVPYVPEQIHKLHRLQRRNDDRPPAIMIQFMTSTARDTWLLAGKKARLSDKSSGQKIYFNENLTYFFKGLLKEAKSRARIHNHRFVWFKNGKIMVKKNEEDRNIIVIKTLDDINKIG
ncbi:uncharacterized protein LOC124358216 [Homalodisca vitripennis]|uniref:uncharacterized protein LOC124358216 n=1 Tax=Homalodisca vitripennis TaxID=197043 RepID=UPI001EE9B12D|nr:uncharacterized protein LOC124358216 [Homalodisca vitripennis]